MFSTVVWKVVWKPHLYSPAMSTMLRKSSPSRRLSHCTSCRMLRPTSTALRGRCACNDRRFSTVRQFFSC